MSEQQQAERIAMTQTQAAEAMGVSPLTIRRWEERGLIRGRRVGGVKLYACADLRRLVGGEEGVDRGNTE